MTAKVAIGWSKASHPSDIKASDLTYTLEENGPLMVPENADNDRIVIWHSDELGGVKNIQMVGGLFSAFNTFMPAKTLSKGGVEGKAYLSVARRVSALMSSEQYLLTFAGE